MHEGELTAILNQAKQAQRDNFRDSGRHLKTEMANREADVGAEAEDDHWLFDCSGCGVNGLDLDDGTHCIACEECNVWQHTKCLGIAKEEAERDDFHFVCRDCKGRMEETKDPKIHFPKPMPPCEPPPVMKRKREEEHGDSPVKKAKSPTSEAKQSNMLSKAPSHPASTAMNRSPSKPQQAVHQPTISPRQSMRSTSSGSMKGPRHSPTQNQPSMSPTQGNPDVGPLVGFSLQPTGTVPSTPSGARSDNILNSSSPYPIAASSTQSPSISFSSAATPHQNNSFSHTPTPNRYSPGMPMSGRSPTKHSPPRPPSFNELGNAAAVLPPVQRLQPSPKLMGRSSPDAPIPPPVKNMTPEQDGRRRREQLAVQQITHQQQKVHQSQSSYALPQNIPPSTSTQSEEQHESTQNIPPLSPVQPQQQQ